MTCEIITIGDEILIGQITDTNSPWIAQQLNSVGISVMRMTSVADTETSIKNALEKSLQEFDLVIVTGGLGPTNDDITKKTITRFFGDRLVLNQKVADHIKAMFEKMNFPFRESDLLQAMLPSKAAVLPNNVGTASGMWFEKDGKVLISLPGVPTEMKHLVIDQVLPKLRETFKLPFILHKTVITYGLRESDMALRLVDFEKQLPHHIKLAYLPNYRKLRLRLTAKGNDKVLLENEIEVQVEKLTSFLSDVVLGYEEFSIEEALGRILIEKKKTLATAESCTGGNIAHLVTMIPGASAYFKGSVVSYSAEVKVKELQVNPLTIKEFSVVSKEVAEQMVIGVKEKFQTDYAIATTGNAGPSTDETDRSVGDVFIAIASPQGVESHYFNFGQPREKVIYRASSKALELLYKNILQSD